MSSPSPLEAISSIPSPSELDLATAWRSYFDNHGDRFDSEYERERLENHKLGLFHNQTRLHAVKYRWGAAAAAAAGVTQQESTAAEPGPQVSTSKNIASPEQIRKLRSELKPKEILFIVIQQRYSWDKLPITESMLWELLSTFSVFPGFFDMLHLFGEKISDIEEDFVVFHRHIARGCAGPESLEILHNYKYPAVRPDYQSPDKQTWVLRKIGLYSRYRPADQTTTWVLLLPGKGRFMDRIETALQKHLSADRAHDMEIRLSLLRTAGMEWNAYMNFLEIEFKELDQKVFLWRPDVKHPLEKEPDAMLEMPDTQRIQRFKVKLHDLELSLDLNDANLQALKRSLLEFRNDAGDGYMTAAQWMKYDRELFEIHDQIMQHKTRVKHLIRCVEGLFSLVCTLIPYMFARRENVMMLQLSEKGTQYAKSMKIITVLCMAFLPASLVAAIFGMGVFTNPAIGVGKLLGLFFAVTSGLCVLTYASWLLWDRRRTKHARKADVETVVVEELEDQGFPSKEKTP